MFIIDKILPFFSLKMIPIHVTFSYSLTGYQTLSETSLSLQEINDFE